MKNILAFIFCTILFGQNTYSQTTAIPDPAFEYVLVSNGIDSDGLVNGQILNSDAVGITSLTINFFTPTYGPVKNLTGIEAFLNLDSCSVISDSLFAINLTANTSLTYFKCAGSHNLKSLNLPGPTALETLLAWSCDSLTSLDLTSNINLKYLDCNSSGISSLNLSSNSNLETLICSSNNLVNLDLSNKLNLEILYCYNNELSNLNLSNNTALALLECDGNNLTNLDLSSNLGLERLQISNNNLNSLDLSNNTALTRLECYSSNLDSLDISNNTALELLECGNNDLTNLDISNNLALASLLCYNNNLVHLDVSNNQALTVNSTSPYNYLLTYGNNPYLQICVADIDTANTRPYWYKDPSATYTENCYPLALKGRLVLDANTNCTADTLERGLIGQVIQFVKDTTTIYVSSFDTLGNYVAHLDTGVYTVSVASPSPYWQFCPSSQQVTIDTNSTLQELDFALQSIVPCPLLEVDIAAPFLRTTGGGSSYYVDYCNIGGVDAQNAYVEVDIDPDLNVLGSSIPVASQVGTVYTFNLGTVPMAECGSFTIQVAVDTSAQFQQTHCTEAHIYPDSICIPNFWNGAILDVQASCLNDTIYFDVTNNGAPMPQAQPYYVFEDHLAMRTGSVQLATSQSITIAQAVATGKTYRMDVTQESGFPLLLGDSVATAVLAGCNAFPNGTFNLGFVTQFSNGNSSPFVAIDCQQNVASYDPNDKTAQPAGYGAAHYIYNNTAIDYKIRFQNTGTDTAFNVTILDTISEYLDITSIEMGASSHPYTWTVHNRVLRVHFADIMLPDSNVNEPLSNGFFRYRIEQKPNNPNGTVIENQAAIYFDYNPAVMTNTTFHTIGENFVSTIITGIEDVLIEDVAVKVYPNPFQEQTTIEVEGGDHQELTLRVYDLMGRMVLQTNATENKIQLQRGNLPQGVYVYRLEGDGELINTGKVIAQ
ncbi:MAG: T9SS type A sorting domain-containing protein [Aureispira sp.]|nr:T9SS type A sorting domain-containing protein [Aureispira sp.]